ncbi:MAG: aspartate carbamoyltransferase regulatory subunit [Candidatus Thorarchaeota archaeon]|nr:MAG: aspartate carbamoyltransferase regulatory subunit [Candidatus Thorarchaeota archaeon]
MSDEIGDDKLRIVKIHDGTVIDHIRAGKALEVLKILGITGEDGNVVSLAMNISSSKIEKKDIVKVEHRFLKDEEVARIALVAPEATINLIENSRLINKYCVELPEIITDIMRCPNQRCVTNKEREPIRSKYQVISHKPIQLKCLYCWTIVEEEHIISEFTS